MATGTLTVASQTLNQQLETVTGQINGTLGLTAGSKADSMSVRATHPPSIETPEEPVQVFAKESSATGVASNPAESLDLKPLVDLLLPQVGVLSRVAVGAAAGAVTLAAIVKSLEEGGIKSSRRDVLKVLAASGVVAFLAACAPKPTTPPKPTTSETRSPAEGRQRINTQFTEQLIEKLGFGPGNDWETVITAVFERTYGPVAAEWKTSLNLGNLGQYMDPQGDIQILKVDKSGEVTISVKTPDSIRFPTKDSRQLEFPTEQGAVVIHGTPETLKRLSFFEKELALFLGQYAAGWTNVSVILHLIYDFDKRERQLYSVATIDGTDNFILANYLGITFTTPYNKTPITRHDICLNMLNIRNQAVAKGMTVKELLVGVLANEKANALAEGRLAEFLPDVYPFELESTFAEYAAAFNPKFASYFLGGEAYNDAADVLIGEMRILEKEGEKT